MVCAMPRLFTDDENLAEHGKRIFHNLNFIFGTGYHHRQRALVGTADTAT